MNNFKKGDTVRCIEQDYCGIKKGNTYIVEEINENNAFRIHSSRFELVTQAMPTIDELAEGKYDVILTRDGHFINGSTYVVEVDEDLLGINYGEEDIIACYKQNGYELELVWSRLEEKTKEEQAIEKIKEVQYHLMSDALKFELEKAINLLKQQ